MGSVRVAVIGVGNCASALVQGIHYYKGVADDGFIPGLMRPRLGDYHVSDIEFTCRKLILEQAGHAVTTALSEREVVSACEQGSFEVVVIGQAVSREQKSRIFSLVRQSCPTAKILELYPPYWGKILPQADDWLQVPLDVPPELADRVTALAGQV